jgi:hypothetical protein
MERQLNEHFAVRQGMFNGYRGKVFKRFHVVMTDADNQILSIHHLVNLSRHEIRLEFELMAPCCLGLSGRGFFSACGSAMASYIPNHISISSLDSWLVGFCIFRPIDQCIPLG